MSELARKIWDAIIIGAGPAGSTAAIQLARSGYQVLLVDRFEFPRAKVCGSCLSGKAVQILSRLQLSSVYDGSIVLDSFELGCCGRQVRLDVRGGRAISRELLDQRLSEVAKSSGTTLRMGVTARLGECDHAAREVQLSGHETDWSEWGRTVVVAAGLGGSMWGEKQRWPEQVDESSRIGLTAILPPDQRFQPGRICMAVGEAGYLGITSLEDRRINVSAAVDKQALKQAGGPASLAQKMIREAGFEVPEALEAADWMGTRELTRRLKTPAAERVFVIGDAAGYVEPFTGEGMAWGIQAAVEVQKVVRTGIEHWDDSLIEQWTSQFTRLMRDNQRTCHRMKIFARQTWIVRGLIPMLRYAPIIARPFIRSIHG